MEYSSFKDLKISRLGMGNMRLPSLGSGPDAKINVPEAEKVIRHAYESGINYFDTAYPYHGGDSEPVLGSILKSYPRESFYLATKLPGHRGGYIQRMSAKEIFEQQLERCGVEYFDFYLLHNVSEGSVSVYRDEKLGIVDYLLEEKRRGRIRHLGFSCHAGTETLESFLDWRPDAFEFVQLQLNYLDWSYQDAKRKYEAVVSRGLPVWVMEPVRGGSLARLRQEFVDILAQHEPGWTQAQWAFDWVRTLPEAKVILSGMNTLEQIDENASVFSRPSLITPEHQATLDKVVRGLRNFVPCTSCRYCCDGCPQSLDIPTLLALYSELALGLNPMVRMQAKGMPAEKQPASCVSCGQCEAACPQGIEIPKLLADFAEMLK